MPTAIVIRNLDVVEGEVIMVIVMDVATPVVIVDTAVRTTTVQHILLYLVGSHTATKQQSTLRFERFTVFGSKIVGQHITCIITELYLRTTHV